MENMMKRRSISTLLAACIIGSAGLGTTALAATSAHSHGHAAAPKLLPAGQRWATDAPLREGMGKIRSALDARLQAVHDNKLGSEQYRALAQLTQQQVGYIVSNCKLQPEADAALHGIIAKLGEGADAMAGKSRHKPREGAVLLAEALDEYGKTFDHPGWKPLH
jgi:hypothetical protein